MRSNRPGHEHRGRRHQRNVDDLERSVRHDFHVELVRSNESNELVRPIRHRHDHDPDPSAGHDSDVHRELVRSTDLMRSNEHGARNEHDHDDLELQGRHDPPRRARAIKQA